MLQRLGFGRHRYVPEPAAPPRPATRAASYAAPAQVAAIPKDEPARHPHLLDMARGMLCLLRIPGICNGDRETVVACHSNLSIHGKGGARKAHDHYSVWGCSSCHAWLDSGPAPAAQKEAAFMAGHVRQVEAWRGIVQFDPFLRDKRAAEWALDRLNATPIGRAP